VDQLESSIPGHLLLQEQQQGEQLHSRVMIHSLIMMVLCIYQAASAVAPKEISDNGDVVSVEATKCSREHLAQA